MKQGVPVLYLDLDGTLLDVSERYYRLHCHLASVLGHRPLARGLFWAGKRRALPLDALLPDWDEDSRQEYGRRWLVDIESPPYTRFDRVLPGVRASLVPLAREAELVLVTLRRDGQELRRQLVRLGMHHWFSRVLAAGDRGPGKMTKAQLLQDAEPGHARNAIVVGDSEEDVQTGRALGCPVVAVLTGIRERPFLEALGPDLIIDSVAQLPGALPSLLIGAAG